MIGWVKALLLPPMPFLATALAGTVVRGGRPLAALSLVVLYLLSTPLVGSALLRSLETYPPLTSDQLRHGAQAVVVLSAEGAEAPEYGGPSVGPLTLVRLRYAAWVHVATGLPVLVSGGLLPEAGEPIAAAMARVLEHEFHVPVAWSEGRSTDTWENAWDSAQILGQAKVKRVLLVTHAWHMPRAAEAFERAGLAVIAAPTGFTERPRLSAEALIPSAGALAASHYALYEMLGTLYYRLAKA
jgi:uncharacterized SAM-binding protein YcdF (DUF218 family)